MNILFLLGNGFDINSGLETNYPKIIKSYCESPSSLPQFEQFKNDIRLWSEFETSMAQYASNFYTEEVFINLVRDFRNFLNNYLLSENKRYRIEGCAKEAIYDEIKDSLKNFYHFGTQNEANIIDNYIKFSYIKYDFISFNYTDCFDEVLLTAAQNIADDHNVKGDYKIENSKLIHIHGKLSGDMALGIDNKEQLHNCGFPITEKLLRAFCKPKLVVDIDSDRFEEALNLINNADIICCFGMSLGISDLTWISAVSDWLSKYNNHHFYYYDFDYVNANAFHIEEKIELSEKAKNKLNIKLNVEEEVLKNQVHIPISANIFNVEMAIKNSTDK